ncbi:GntR family transcriptional regulator [Curtobacterium pusillum]|uniref:GntR family transcriptional regulator n=1 Tax=Curtobacterium pusillum TaxID=69373 RepID=A0AAW3T3S1_9MICO|nr:GntR family transcriptional regulator [Curtobacterium pusillum]MBA8989536.1 GntR family transcriptional regulator [Curtobacterium pusillum]GLK32532.1 GntR family transcriptional regulator [Curtobacterium pusillum]
MADFVYKQIADALRTQILDGELAPGDDVPTEGELAVRWNTSRGPIRNALAELRAEGLIESTRGRPSRVRTRQVQQRADVYTPFTTWARSFHRTPGARTEELAVRRADEHQAAALGIESGERVVDVVRLRTLDGRPAMLERSTFVESVGRLLFEFAQIDQESITEFLATRGHRFADVAHEIDAIAADALDSQLMEVAEGSPILRVRRTSIDADGRPFEFSDDRYRSDVVRFTVAASGNPGFMQPRH